MASIEDYSEYEHLQEILMDAISDKKVNSHKKNILKLRITILMITNMIIISLKNRKIYI